MQRYDRLFIGGEWVRPASRGVLRVISPTTEEPIATAVEAVAEDIDQATAAAVQAFEHGSWPRMSADDRAAVLEKMAVHLRERTCEIADLLVDECGITIGTAQGTTQMAAMMLDYYAGIARNQPAERVRQGMMGEVTVRQEPCGVVAAIVPWNSPL